VGNDEQLFSKIITGDITVGPQGISTAKKARTQNSSGKLMATMFWDMQEILLMKKGSTIREVYRETIKTLKTDRRQKRPHNCDLNIMLNTRGDFYIIYLAMKEKS
jgi:hypothetical protein